MIEAVDPFLILPTSMSNTYNAFDNLHMLRMCIWMCPYHIVAALQDHAFGSELEFQVTPRRWMMVKCSDWGCRPIPDSSHINVKHIQCIWQPSYAMDVHMDASLPHYRCSSRPCFWKSELEFWVTPRQWMIVKCGDWGCRPIPHWSHINVKHIQCIWQPSYAVDVHMDVSLPHYSCSCWSSFWMLARNLGNRPQATNDG